MILRMRSLVKLLFSPSFFGLIFLLFSAYFLLSNYFFTDIGERVSGTIIRKSISNNFIPFHSGFILFFYFLIILPIFFFNKERSSQEIKFNFQIGTKKHTNFFHLAFGINFLLLCFIFFTANTDVIFNAESYSEITEPSILGVNPIVLRLMILYQIFIGFILGATFRNNVIYNIFNLIPFLLLTLIPLSGFSRAGLLPLASFFLANIISSKGSIKTLLKIVFYVFIFFILYLIVMLFRGEQALWSNPPGFGYLGFFRSFFLLGELSQFILQNGDEYGSIFEIIFGNIVNGSSIYYESIAGSEIKYNYSFQLQSIFSLSSELDNFNDTYLKTQERISFFIPMNTLGELYFFDLGFKILAMSIISIVFFISQKIYFSLPTELGILLCSPLYLFIFYSSQYSTRTSFKYLLFEIFILAGYFIYTKLYLARKIKK